MALSGSKFQRPASDSASDMSLGRLLGVFSKCDTSSNLILILGIRLEQLKEKREKHNASYQKSRQDLNNSELNLQKMASQLYERRFCPCVSSEPIKVDFGIRYIPLKSEPKVTEALVEAFKNAADPSKNVSIIPSQPPPKTESVVLEVKTNVTDPEFHQSYLKRIDWALDANLDLKTICQDIDKHRSRCLRLEEKMHSDEEDIRNNRQDYEKAMSRMSTMTDKIPRSELKR